MIQLAKITFFWKDYNVCRGLLKNSKFFTISISNFYLFGNELFYF